MWRRSGLALLLSAWPCGALEPSGVFILANGNSAVSKSVAEYYSMRRGIPKKNVILIRTTEAEEIDRATFDAEIARRLRPLIASGDKARIDALVLTKGIPLKIRGVRGGMNSDGASVDSELAALPLMQGGGRLNLDGPVRNPYFASPKRFARADFPMFLVTRLDGYTFADVKAIIDRSLEAKDAGVAVLDGRGDSEAGIGDEWLRSAAKALPATRVRADFTTAVLSGIQGVIAYASWGSNDRARKERDTRMIYLPGAIVTQYVSTDARTFKEPPAEWNITTWENRAGWFAGSPQSLAADAIRQGATGVAGHVYEPYLQFSPRPDILVRSYIAERRTLAESFWAAIPAVSWMNVVVGDPLCRLRD